MRRARRKAFTLVELLVVIAIIALLAAIIFPVIIRAKDAGRKSACISNLKQVGSAIIMDMSDHDDIFPHAVDAADKFAPQIWAGQPEWQARIAAMPMLHEAIQPYLKNYNVFLCPADTGTFVLDNSFPEILQSSPTLHRTYGSSYFFRTEIAFRFYSQTFFELPANINVLMDGAGHWHGSEGALRREDDPYTYFRKVKAYRYNTLFGDMHVKSLTFDQLQGAWSTPL